MASFDLTTLFTALPDSLRDDLLNSLTSIEQNYREARWEPSELNGGKLCEAAYTILRGHVDGNYPARAAKPANMVDACRQLEQAGNQFSRSIRIQIPRMLMALYEIRNNRGVGHVGGDVAPNHMDAVCVLQMSKWVVAELIRAFHQVSTDEAQAVVDGLTEREIPLIWEINGRMRILNGSLTMKQKTLALLYAKPAGQDEDELVADLEHSNKSVYRRDVLKRAHKERLIEYDSVAKRVHISPLGIREVEEKILA